MTRRSGKGKELGYKVGLELNNASDRISERIELVVKLMGAMDQFSHAFQRYDDEIAEVVNCVSDLLTAVIKRRQGFEVCPVDGELDERDVSTMLSILSVRLQDSEWSDFFDVSPMTSTGLANSGFSKPYSSTVSIG